jgi:hypothetical protein
LAASEHAAADKRAGTNTLAVGSQLFHHPLPIEFPFYGVLQEHPDKAAEKFLVRDKPKTNK